MIYDTNDQQSNLEVYVAALQQIIREVAESTRVSLGEMS